MQLLPFRAIGILSPWISHHHPSWQSVGTRTLLARELCKLQIAAIPDARTRTSRRLGNLEPRECLRNANLKEGQSHPGDHVLWPPFINLHGAWGQIIWDSWYILAASVLVTCSRRKGAKGRTQCESTCSQLTFKKHTTYNYYYSFILKCTILYNERCHRLVHIFTTHSNSILYIFTPHNSVRMPRSGPIWVDRLFDVLSGSNIKHVKTIMFRRCRGKRCMRVYRPGFGQPSISLSSWS
jgi:hypothetical protein